MSHFALINAKLVGPNETERGSVLIEDGCIAKICPEILPAGVPEIDLEGNLLAPGLVDLHSDAIEHEVQPRPRTLLPFDLAVRQADRLFATVGVTTPFHSLSFVGEGLWQRPDDNFAADFARSIVRLGSRAIVDNRVHVRFEITNRVGLPIVQKLVEDGVASLVSIMDHTPGQGQYPDASRFKAYLKGMGHSDEEIEEIMDGKHAAADSAGPTIEAFTATARAYHVPIASHDEDRPERLHENERLGITITEFPMNLETAELARDLGFCVMVGAPNVIRGQSTGAGPKAMEVIERCDGHALCSDYMPATILPAIFKISEELGWPLEKALRLGSYNPARAAQLEDRGEIAVGQRADLIEVELHHGWPIVRKLWSAGRLTYASTPMESAVSDRWSGEPLADRRTHGLVHQDERHDHEDDHRRPAVVEES